jgi:FlaA1/EpsC-like NDP-sugar epimerase
MSLPEEGKRNNQVYISRVLLAAYDLGAVVISMVLAIILRFEQFRPELLVTHLPSLPLVLATYLLAFIGFRLYRYWWRFASVELFWSIMLANLIAGALSVVWQVYFDGEFMPRSVTVMTFVLATALIGVQRLLLRLLSGRRREDDEQHIANSPWGEEPKRTIVLADGHSVIEVLTALEKDSRHYNILGILVDDPRHHGSFLRGYQVLGPLNRLHDHLHRHDVDEVIIAIPETGGDELREYVLACTRHKVAVRVVPVLARLLDNPSSARGRLRLQDIRVEDLLHRPPALADLREFGQYLTGRRVMITGAGGSIGSELCRQIGRMDPARMILLGHGENSIFEIAQELRRTYPNLADRMVNIICDVRDAPRLNAAIAEQAPDILFHAAAHKHVPLMEANVAEAVANNVGGTRNVVRAATRHGVDRMVLISTDKAVNPTSIMGATKFLCEEVARAETRHSDTRFLTVRFGNVLGSRGSVLPTFQEQILYGGPVSVTHQEMRRYFMTIPEAVSLVLKAGAGERTGNLFVLDMGEPVRILDLAEDIIRLFGLEPYRDIRIEFCGLRPGEKLFEELLSDAEVNTVRTEGKLMVVHRPQYLDPDELDRRVATLLHAARSKDDDEIRRLLADILPSLEQSPEVLRAAA